MNNRDIVLESLDINVWYRNHEICPNCGLNLRTMHPLMNLFPHWTGGCIEPEPPASEPEPKYSLWQHIKWLWRDLEDAINGAMNSLIGRI